MDTVDTSSYGLYNKQPSSSQQAAQIQQNRANRLKNQQAMQGIQPQAPSTVSTPYGQGTDMSLLGAGAPYGSNDPYTTSTASNDAATPSGS